MVSEIRSERTTDVQFAPGATRFVAILTRTWGVRGGIGSTWTSQVTAPPTPTYLDDGEGIKGARGGVGEGVKSGVGWGGG